MFCKYCGKKLTNNEKCDCQRKTQSVEKKQAADESESNFIELGIKCLKKPVDNIKTFVSENNYKKAIILLLIHALIGGLYLSNFFGSLESFLVNILAKESASTPIALDIFNISIPTKQIFIYLAISLALTSFVYAYTMGENILIKGGPKYKKVLSSMQSAFICSSIIKLGGILFNKIYFPIGLILALIGDIVFFILLFKGLKVCLNGDDNKKLYYGSITYGISLVIILTIIISLFANS